MTRLMALIEARVVRAADGVICNARNFARVMARQYPATRVEFVPNAVDTDSLPRHVGATPHRLAVACTGTIYGERDLRPLLAALRRFIDRHPEAPSSAVKLRVAGHTDSPRGHAARIEAAKLELAAHVEWLGIIPRKEVWQLLSQSGLGVVLAQDQGFQVPAKLYELVGIGVPTLVIAERGSASAEEGERVGAYVVSPDDQEGMGAVLEAVWSGHARPPAVTAQAVGYQQLADAVHALLADRGRDRR
jgi:glycosyltransferase involved in cell wall biosynthesis